MVSGIWFLAASFISAECSATTPPDIAAHLVAEAIPLLDKIGGSRLMRLKNEPHLGYSTTH